MGWLTNLITTYGKGKDYDDLEEVNKKLVKTTEDNALEITELKNNINSITVDYKNCDLERVKLFNELESLKLLKGRHESLATYKDFLDNAIFPTVKYYDFGKGRKQVHTIFADSLKDEEIVREFIKDDLKFDGSTCDSANDLIFKFSRAMSLRYPTRNFYASDEQLYGMTEYWATAKETILLLRENDDAFDCDDMMSLKYSCLIFLLRDFFPEDEWRIRGFIVDLWGNIGGHALLGWVKEGVNDFVPIETTYMDTAQAYIWNGDYTIRTQLFYKVRYSFDNKHEYIKI